MTTKARVRTTKAQIVKAREKLLISQEQKTAKKQESECIYRTYKDFWYGLVYCDHQGLAV